MTRMRGPYPSGDRGAGMAGRGLQGRFVGAVVLAAAAMVPACHDFERDLEACRDAGRCADADAGPDAGPLPPAALAFVGAPGQLESGTCSPPLQLEVRNAAGAPVQPST